MQTYLEKKGIKERATELVRNDYNQSDEYSSRHKDALSDGDPQGKGTGHGGHGFSIPDQSKEGRGIDYSNFDTENGGGQYDIEGKDGVGGRNYLTNISLYNEETSYGPNIVDTLQNRIDGQIVL